MTDAEKRSDEQKQWDLKAERSVGDLAIGLGQLIAHEGGRLERQPAYECFVESVLTLAFQAGVKRSAALAPFDLHQDFAAKFWADLTKQASSL